MSPYMGQLADWLQAHLPPDPPRPFVVHGDFRLDNLVFDQRPSKVGEAHCTICCTNIHAP